MAGTFQDSLRDISTELEEAQYQVTMNRSDRGQDEYLTGIVRGMALAMQRARTMAAGGWKVVVEPLDRNDPTEVRITLEPLQ